MTAQLPSNVIIDISKHQLIKQAYELCQAIEMCGASPALTGAVNKAGVLMQDIANLLTAYEQEPVANHIGSKNALDAIVAFIKSNSNPTLNDYNSVSERLFADNCQSLSSHVIEYITRIGEALEDLRQDAVHPAPVPAVPECFERLLAHAQGIAMGVDWNKGTAATHHRDKLCQAVKDCTAMLNGGKS